MDRYSFDTGGLNRCLIMVFAGATNLVAQVNANIEAVRSSTHGPLGVVALTELPSEGTRISLFRDGTRVEATGIAADLDLGDAAVIEEFFTRALISLPADCNAVAGFRGHGTGTVTLHDQAAQLLRALVRRKLLPSTMDLGPLLAGLREEAAALWDLVRRPLYEPFFLPTNNSKGTLLTIFEVRQALERAFGATERHCELLFLDSCYNATFEFWLELSGITDKLVASEQGEETDGWPYAAWLGAIAPAATTADVIGAALAQYKSARETDGSLSAYTLGFLGDITPALTAFRVFAKALLDSPQGVANVRAVVKALPPVLNGGLYDLQKLCSGLRAATGDAAVRSAAETLEIALGEARRAFVTDAPALYHGVSIFLPVLPKSFDEVVQKDFARLQISKESVWLDFLTKLTTPPFS